jgi:hypothetical protein
MVQMVMLTANGFLMISLVNKSIGLSNLLAMSSIRSMPPQVVQVGGGSNGEPKASKSKPILGFSEGRDEKTPDPTQDKK